MRCSQGTWLEVGKAVCSSKRAHTNTKFASFFMQARILTGHKSQTLNHCTVDLQVAYKQSSFSPSLPPCLLSLHHTHEIFLLVLFHLISQTSFTQPDYTHPIHVGSEGRLATTLYCLLQLGSVQADSRLMEGEPSAESWPPQGTSIEPSHEDSLCLQATPVIPSACWEPAKLCKRGLYQPLG